jgi:hypothetical protein
MKELQTHSKINNQEKIELSVKKKNEVEYVLHGTLKPKKGHFIWEINEETGEVKKAEFKRTTAIFGASIPPQELLIKPDCVYIPALNAKNAKKKYLNNKEQSAYFSKPPLMNLSDIIFK